MSFFNLSDGNNAAQTDGAFESSTSMEPIAANTQLLACVDEAKWDEYDGDQYISLRWTIMAPEEHKNRKIFQKVRVNDAKPEKADKAKRMLAAIDKNAGGKLAASGAMPTDESMTMALCHKPMVIRVQVWSMERDGQTNTGNWIDKVAPRNGGQQAAPAPQPAVPAAPTAGADDNIPF